MTTIIVWSQDNGSVAVCIPTGVISLEDVISKDVPNDRPHYVKDLSDLPIPFDDPRFDLMRLDSQGNITLATDSFPRVSITRLRFILVTSQAPSVQGRANLYEDIQAACTATGGLAPVYLKESATFESDHPMVLGTSQALGLTAEYVYGLFIQAQTMNA